MIRYSDFDCRIIPVLGSGTWKQLDRIQSIDKTGTLNKIKVKEVGRDGTVEYVDQPPAVTYRAMQYEYGNLSTFLTLANKADNITSLTLNDFQTSTFDICSYLTDNDGVFKGTNFIPKLRLAGFSFNIGNPKGLVERNFDLVGEDWIDWQGNNKYLIYKEKTVESGDLGSADAVTIVVASPSAVQDPNDLNYILRVVRIRAGVSTELVAGTDYSYAAPNLTVEDCQASDLIKYWYTASAYITGISPFVNNDVDLPAIAANSCSIYLETGNYVYRLQSITIDARLEREDKDEIGNVNVVQRGVKSKTVTITLGRTLETFTIEEILAGKAPGYGKLDIRKFSDNFTLRVKFFSNSDKTVFKTGLKCITLAPSDIKGGTSIDNFVEQGNTLTGEDLELSSLEATIDL